MPAPDYYAVNVASGKRCYSLLCNVLAESEKDAMRIARNHGFKLPRGSFARHIGRQGYFAALRLAFGGAIK
jgi:hypothetical protein